MAPVTGGGPVRVQVWPPSLEVAVLALFGLAGSKSPPPTMPCKGSRKATVNAPPLGELASGVSCAFQVLPPSRVAKILATDAPPVAIQAFLPPWVATQVPLEAKENSPGSAAGMLSLMSCHVVPSSVRRAGNSPLTGSLCAMPLLGFQKAKQS